MTVYKCHAKRGECDLVDRCFIANIRPVHGDHVMHFISDRKGEFCPHYMPIPKDSDDPQP